jgi:predicted RNA-binding protein with PIN domain
MAHILIDGYNFIGTAHGNLEKARTDFIKQLQEYSRIKKHHITVVFDGWKDGKKDETQSRSRNLTVIYSRLGEKADDVIRKMTSSGAKSWIVVSSDREVSEYALNKEHAAIGSHDFERKLYAVLEGSDIEEADNISQYEDDDKLPGIKKGNPRTLSKRDRKRLQALRKL